MKAYLHQLWSALALLTWEWILGKFELWGAKSTLSLFHILMCRLISNVKTKWKGNQK